MKRQVLASLLAAAVTPAFAQVSASINIGEPNFYGQINIGDVPEPPRVIYAEPRVVERVHVVEEPVYLRVPPGHAKHWDKHCHEYHACNRPVYFVQDDWYQRVYAPHYQEHHGHHEHGDHDDQGEDHDHGHGHGHDHDKHDRD
jgi:hypothetical protein